MGVGGNPLGLHKSLVSAETYGAMKVVFPKRWIPPCSRASGFRWGIIVPENL